MATRSNGKFPPGGPRASAAQRALSRAGRERDELLSQLVAVCMEELFTPDGRVDGTPGNGAVDKVSVWT